MSDVLAVSDAKRQLGALVDRAHLRHEPVYLSRRGHRVVAIVDAEDFDRLLELAEDAADAAAAVEARREMAETAATPVPWAEVKAELGLT
ncbi:MULTISPECIES: type II toxin-antitoxin system Phd/YefM family antitoxin [unclassified Frigoribacterium]|jgi:prevent-host-death family protein|uniref:type II toxin-antitoxin system Phd/YefM family antitoxin n=1 Tax=unclassified Frigoribacterium TaxID=2627005 RepID=UPI0006FAE9F8|nr:MULTISPECIES: type II toxin-antitoxin system Phd/YefM family antitoxin [unclassified Frigoribacterium]KQO47707.1 prevent-host-death protein [Frigoribacterium sp. Leaf254]KQT39800.1 prevent-host-death protein [Frigoribacterium sp. Leaf415]